MFKKLTKGISSAASAIDIGSNNGDSEKIETIKAMGFTAEQARNALACTGDGNVERALEMLLAQPQSNFSHSSTSSSYGTANSGGRSSAEPIDLTNEDDVQLQVAMEESLISESERQTQQQMQNIVSIDPPSRPNRSAPSARSGDAALKRLESRNQRPQRPKKIPQKNTKTPTKPIRTTTSATGVVATLPSDRVKAPAPLKSKSKEEQIQRCAARVAPYPLAVDTLLKAFSELKADPRNPKYKVIDKSNPGFRRALENVPGAEDLLLATNFRPRPGNVNTLVLNEREVDAALLWMACSALENARETEDYRDAKNKLTFHKTIKDIQDGKVTAGGLSVENETVARANFISKCPSEPTGGQGALMNVVIADQTIRRRFDGDDVLRDVINWIGGHGSVIPEKILSREFCLVDLNRYPIAPIGCAEDLNKTLQFIGCWPSGRLELRQSDDEWRLSGKSSVRAGSARGLGAHT